MNAAVGLKEDMGALPGARARQFARELVAIALRLSGLPWLIRALGERGNRATVLVYHNPPREAFDRHLAFLARRYSFVTLDCLVQAIRARDWSAMPRRPLVITIDDGRRENYELLEVARRHGVKPTIFICTQIVGSLRPFWFLRVAGAEKKKLKALSNAERLLHINARADHATPRQALSADEMQQMASTFDFQSHTCTHPVLPTCTDDECRQELAQSRRDVEERFGRPCLHFAYPHGDYNERDCQLAKEGGYLSARTIDLGWNDVDTDPYRLKVQGITDTASVNMLAVQLSGLVVYLKYLLQGSASGRKPAARAGQGR